MSEPIYGIVTPSMTKSFRTYQKHPYVCEYVRNPTTKNLDIVKIYKFDKNLQITKIDTYKHSNPFVRFNSSTKTLHDTIFTEFEYLSVSGTDGELLLFNNIRNAMATKMLFMDFLQDMILKKIEDIEKSFNKNMPSVYDKENLKNIKNEYAEYFI